MHAIKFNQREVNDMAYNTEVQSLRAGQVIIQCGQEYKVVKVSRNSWNTSDVIVEAVGKDGRRGSTTYTVTSIINKYHSFNK